ncbi:MAG TPA: alanine racemase [Candidatus Eremiobacteraceae bacterium]
MKQPWLRFDADAIEHNARVWRSVLAPRALWPVVKSDAYRLGAVAVARACVRAGAPCLVIADIDEAAPLRAAGIGVPLMHVMATADDALAYAVRAGVIPSVADSGAARQLAAIAQWKGGAVRAHVAVDTGTGWSGVPAWQAKTFAAEVRKYPGIDWAGAWTHIASEASMHDQAVAFAGAVDDLRSEGLPVRIVHLASTGPAVWGAGGDAARIGIGLFGAAFGDARLTAELRTAVEVRAAVTGIKRFSDQTPLGYGGLDSALAGDAIATLRIGYADGMPRIFPSDGVVLIRGVRCGIVGAVGMNFTMVRLAPEVRDAVAPGDDGIVLGDFDGVRLDAVAKSATVLPHQLITGFGTALRREAPVNDRA